MREKLHSLIEEHDELADLDPAARRLQIRALMAREGCKALGDTVATLADLIDGVGPLTPLLADESVTDVLVNGPSEVWIERAGVLSLTEVRFEDEGSLLDLIERVLAQAGARADASRPIADARLADGSRVHVVLPPVAQSGPLVSVRRHRRKSPELNDLIAMGTLSGDDCARLRRFVSERASVVIGGPTGSGKTTLLAALLGEIGPDERVVIIEETSELRPACPHSISLLTRPPNLEGKGVVALADLVRAALRMRPDRIVVGEVRGSETWAALDAMSTGHRGSMLTVHSGSAAQSVDRLCRLARESPACDSEVAAAALVRESVDVVVHMDRQGGNRRVVDIHMTDHVDR